MMLTESKKLFFWRRFFAFIIDVIIIQLIVSLGFYPHLRNKFAGIDLFNLYEIIQSGELASLILTITIVYAVVSLIYWSVLEYKMRSSVGKLLFNLSVECKGKPSYWKFLVRNISKSLSFIEILNIIFLIDVIYSFFTKERLFERISKTRIVMSKKIIRKFKKNK